jgi:hypothetical protein
MGARHKAVLAGRVAPKTSAISATSKKIMTQSNMIAILLQGFFSWVRQLL